MVLNMAGSYKNKKLQIKQIDEWSIPNSSNIDETRPK